MATELLFRIVATLATGPLYNLWWNASFLGDSKSNFGDLVLHLTETFSLRLQLCFLARALRIRRRNFCLFLAAG